MNPNTLVRDLSLSRRQMVEIAKALGMQPKVLILDEATSALTSRDVETVYGLLGDLKNENVASLFISHRMHEVDRLLRYVVCLSKRESRRHLRKR